MRKVTHQASVTPRPRGHGLDSTAQPESVDEISERSATETGVENVELRLDDSKEWTAITPTTKATLTTECRADAISMK